MASTARPAKRQKLTHAAPRARARSPSPAHPDADAEFKPLPPPHLLLSLPALLAQPPSSRFHAQALCLSLAAVRACLAQGALSPDVECRAWTALAEVGMAVVSGGCAGEAQAWAVGVESEVEKAIAKGTLIAQKHPSLTIYLHHLTALHARLAQWQHNTKFARKLLARLTSSFLPSDPPHIVYAAHLARINNFITASSPTSAPHASPAPSAQDVHAALAAIDTLQDLAEKNGHEKVVLLSRVLRLRTLVAAEMWDTVQATLQPVEDALGLAYDAASTPKPQASAQPPQTSYRKFDEPFETAMAVHALVLGVAFLTHAGQAADASARLAHLHLLLDAGALERFPAGVVEVSFEGGAPLAVQVTHPRVLYMLTFLVSCAAKRDAVGRKPKRKVFAAEGLAAWEREMGKEVVLPAWASVGDVEEVQQRMARIKADLLCELVAVGIMRSEFGEAQRNLDLLIAHTRTYDIFELFAARTALHQGHLAHALGKTSKALQCYDTASFLAGKDKFVDMAARTGELVLRLGMLRTAGGDDARGEMKELGAELEVLAKRCRGQGAALEAVGQVLESCLATEILKSKQHLKHALSLASRAQDNYLRALVLALIAAHYLHTAQEHARAMLETCEQLAMGLGAPVQRLRDVGVGGRMGRTKVEVVAVGNVPLRMWCGERFLDLYRREGNEGEVRKREAVNNQLLKSAPARAGG